MRQLTLATFALLLFASAANAQYVGVTATTFDGQQGVFTYNLACHAAHPGSRMCTSEEVMETVNPPIVGSPGEVAWVRPVLKPVATGASSSISTDASGVTTSPYNLSCDGWTSDEDQGLTVQLDTGEFAIASCFPAQHRVSCCIPVPEPSAALSIPSGAGMLLALAKLRGVGLGR